MILLDYCRQDAALTRKLALLPEPPLPSLTWLCNHPDRWRIVGGKIEVTK